MLVLIVLLFALYGFQCFLSKFKTTEFWFKFKEKFFKK